MKISVCIITFNEEHNIRRVIESVDWADEILIVDSESADQTVEIAANLGARVLIQKWLGFGRQKQFAVGAATHDWIFSLDADERISDGLRGEILNLKNTPENRLAGGYKIPRLTFYMNRPIRHGGWYPDWQLRFFDRRRGGWKDCLIHESVRMNDGVKIERLASDILHSSIDSASEHHKLIGTRYAPLAARQMFESGRRTSFIKLATVGATTFAQNYFLKLGFLDGSAGFFIARFSAYHAFLKHLILWELQTTKTPVDTTATNRRN